MYENSFGLKVHCQVWDNILANESPLKMMKNAFYFTLKAVVVLKTFKFLSWSFSLVEKRLDEKDKVNFKKKRKRKKTMTIYILPNISRSKDNQIMKLGQLIQYNMRNVFLEKSYTKCGGETSLRHFSEKSKLSISLGQ